MSSGEHTEESLAPLADAAAETARLRNLAERILAQGEHQPLPFEVIQEGLSSLSKLYSVHHEKGERRSPFAPDSSMPPTVALILVSAMLKAVDVEPFEVGMWRAWSGA